MKGIRRRDFLRQAGELALAGSLRPAEAAAVDFKLPPLLPPPGWYVPESALPVLMLDVEASIASGRIVTQGPARADAEWGAVILVPGGAAIPAAWWGMRIGRHTELRDGARLVLRSADPARPARLAAPGKEGVLELRNLSARRVLMQVEDLDITAGPGGDAIRIDRASAVTLRRLRIAGGKNGVFAAHHPTDLVMEQCEISRAGRGDGYTHNLYTGYIRSLSMRDCLLHAPAAPGHCFKCYAQHVDARGNTFAHYREPEDLAAGFYGALPLIDRGAWGHTVMADNLFIRRGPARPAMIDLRNRAFPPGFRRHVQPDWGTEPMPFAEVDNRDPANPHLFRHLFFRNTLVNGLLPDGSPDPFISREPGIFLRNNGSAPWNASAAGEHAGGRMPAGWRPWHERTVAYLCGNRLKGVPPAMLAQAWAHRRPDFATPVQEWERLPGWAAAWAGL